MVHPDDAWWDRRHGGSHKEKMMFQSFGVPIKERVFLVGVLRGPHKAMRCQLVVGGTAYVSFVRILWRHNKELETKN
ncbi:hypothetical protein CFP56_011425 [Quercus suber]|uniref:Uncharacterized protein n=1 Tax=Quercus suber TaxID=58331 RepID=A0AAW0M5E7_QUESU